MGVGSPGPALTEAGPSFVGGVLPALDLRRYFIFFLCNSGRKSGHLLTKGIYVKGRVEEEEEAESQQGQGLSEALSRVVIAIVKNASSHKMLTSTR